MNEEMEMIIMNLIVDAGSARSFAMEAIACAKEGKFEDAQVALDQADTQMSKAHKMQTELIQNEAKGNRTEMNLFMVHAQDHIMTAMLAKEMAREIVELYDRIENPNKRV